MALLVYVDNIIIVSNNLSIVNTVKIALAKKFRMKDLGPLR